MVNDLIRAKVQGLARLISMVRVTVARNNCISVFLNCIYAMQLKRTVAMFLYIRL